MPAIATSSWCGVALASRNISCACRLRALIRRWRSFFHCANGMSRSSRLRNYQLLSTHSRPQRRPLRTASMADAFSAGKAFLRSESFSSSCQTGVRHAGVETRWELLRDLCDQLAQGDDLLHGPLIR